MYVVSDRLHENFKNDLNSVDCSDNHGMSQLISVVEKFVNSAQSEVSALHGENKIILETVIDQVKVGLNRMKNSVVDMADFSSEEVILHCNSVKDIIIDWAQ